MKKEYRVRSAKSVNGMLWSEWRSLDVPLKDHDIMTIQFNEALTVEESEKFFKNYEVK